MDGAAAAFLAKLLSFFPALLGAIFAAFLIVAKTRKGSVMIILLSFSSGIYLFHIPLAYLPILEKEGAQMITATFTVIIFKAVAAAAPKIDLPGAVMSWITKKEKS